MIDWQRLNTLRDDIGEDDFGDVAMLFVTEMTEHLDRLAGAPELARMEDFHFLRGSAANMGLSALVDACGHAEAACLAGLPPDLEGVSALFDASLSVLRSDLPELGEAA